MKLIRLTPDNVRYYIGHEIFFKSSRDPNNDSNFKIKYIN